MKCVECHPGAKDQERAGLPSTRTCMACHILIKADSPEVRKLAAAHKRGEPIPWARVYTVPSIVFFSHASHAKAGADCVACHGPVAERDVLRAEISTGMQRCVDCHRQHKASTDCALCHQLGM
jgi:hypothetical protein